MGSFIFKWEHPASEVYVTGTFDNWSKSEQLVKTGDVFEKNVTLPSASEKIYYKFVVDGNWCTDHTAPQENDPEGNLNNVLTTERIVKHTPATAGIMSGVTPTSTTATLAKDVPKEAAGSSDLPGTFPETPASEPAAFSVNPIPASEGAGNPIKLAPGEKVPDPSTFNKNTITSTVKDEGEQTFGVTPIPATAGAGNPIKLAAGEPVPPPSQLTSNTINSTVTTDKESYEKSDLPPVSKNMIPESSLPIGGSGVGTFDATPTIQSAGPQSTTALLAGAVPLESSKATVPEIVKESQAEAGVGPEASAVPEEVKEKSAVEKELLSEVPVAAVTSDGTTTESPIKAATGVTAGEAAAAVGGAAVAIGGAAAAFAIGAKDKAVEATKNSNATSYLPKSVQDSIASMNATSSVEKTADVVPETVKESIAESGQSPEAAAYPEEVAEKQAVEKELLAEVKKETSTGESAPIITGNSTLAVPASVATPDSRDISPTTVPGSHSQTVPEVTTGVASTTTEPVTPAKAATPAPTTPASSAAGSSAAVDAKKKKRSSFFGKLKAKFSDKDKSSK